MKGTRHAVSLACICLLAALAGSGTVLGATAVTTDDPPMPPAAYYGDIEVNGEPAPPGITIEAIVDGEVRGLYTVEKPGQFGGPGIDEEKLVVSGDGGDTGEPVTFQVQGQDADTTPAEVSWEGGDVSELSLTVDDVDTSDPVFGVAIDEETSTTEVDPGEAATIVAVIDNDGGLTGSATVEFTVDGERVNDTVVEVIGADSTTVTFEHVLEEEGTYDVAVRTADDEATVTLVVGDPPDAPPAMPPPVDPAEWAVTATHVSDAKIDAGESVEVTATIENLGGESETFTAKLVVDGTVIDERTVTVDGGETATVAFDATFDEAGEYEIAVNDEFAGALTVVESSPGPAPANLSVVDTDLSETTLEVGESVAVTATVENAGDVRGTATVSVTVDGTAVDDREVEVDGGETATVTFHVSMDEPGEYEIHVEDVGAGTVTVTDPQTDDDTDIDDTDDDDGIPGFGIGVSILALLAIALTAVRRLGAP